MSKYLIGRVADPIFGIFVGTLAYYLWETDPKNASQRPEGRKLLDLARRKWQPTQTPATS